MNIKPLFFAFIFSTCASLNLPAEQLPFDLRSGSCDNSIFYMADQNNGWARATNAILQTSDGGTTWKKVLSTESREPMGALSS